MKYETELKRQAHPLAKLIPYTVWHCVFNSELTALQAQLFNASLEELNSLLLEINSYIKKEAQAAWHCIAFNHHHFSKEFLVNIGLDDLGLHYNELFVYAARLSRMDLLEYLVKLRPDKIQEMLRYGEYAAFIAAAKNGTINIVRYIMNLLPQEISRMLAAQDYVAFRLAAQSKQSDTFFYLVKQACLNIQLMISAKQYAIFACAMERADPDILNYLVEQVRFKSSSWRLIRLFMDSLRPYLTDKLQLMIEANQFLAFRTAAHKGHVELLKFLEALAPLKLQQMIAAEQYCAFIWGASEGHLDVLMYLCQKAPEQVEAMIRAEDFSAFRLAAQNGHLHILKFLFKHAAHLFQEMLAKDNYAIVQDAAAYGQLEVLVYFVSLAQGSVSAMLSANDFAAFQAASEHGYLDILLYFERLAPDLLQAMIAAHDYDAFQGAALNGHMHVLLYLLNKAAHVRDAMMTASEFQPFQYAAEAGQLEVLEFLAHALPQRLHEMISNSEYYALRIAVEKERSLAVAWLFEHSLSCFAYAESKNYSVFLNYYTNKKLTRLKAQKKDFQRRFPQEQFDIQELGILHYCFYMSKILIRQAKANQPISATLRENLLFILSLPSFRPLAHRSIDSRESNELLQLALAVGNEDVVQILMTIPAVRILAEQNHFYRQDSVDAVSVAQLAQIRESSMLLLSRTEQLQLNELIACYQVKIQQFGIEHLMTALRQWLLRRYLNNPAVIKIQAENKVLPYDWLSFNRLELSESDYHKALRAYYCHPDHSAWRYLLKPNPWIEQSAQFVELDPSRPLCRWSSFSTYQTLIVIFWLAAIDETIPAVHGHSMKGRAEHFVRELALIGRAHNWDKTRRSMEGQIEEYDDMEGDKPSCHAGVKRRLFQSVLGHPLLTLLTRDDIKHEVCCFVRQHFLKQITPDNAQAIKQALEEHVLTLEPPAAILYTLNIPQSECEAFLTRMMRQYGAQFSHDSTLMQHARTLLTIKEQGEPIECLHALKFVNLVHLMQMLEQPLAVSTGSNLSHREQRFFKRRVQKEQLLNKETAQASP